jgi:hypothetical protein
LKPAFLSSTSLKKVNNEDGGTPAVYPKMMLKILFYMLMAHILLERTMTGCDGTLIMCVATKIWIIVLSVILQYDEEIKVF